MFAPIRTLAEAREIASKVFETNEWVAGVHVEMTFGEIVVDREGVCRLAAEVAA